MSESKRQVQFYSSSGFQHIEGNELADRFAKEATKKAEVNMAIKYSKSEIKSVIKKEIDKSWQQEWDKEKIKVGITTASKGK